MWTAISLTYNRNLYKRGAMNVYLIEHITNPNFIVRQVFAELDEMKCAYIRRGEKRISGWQILPEKRLEKGGGEKGFVVANTKQPNSCNFDSRKRNSASCSIWRGKGSTWPRQE